MDLDGGYTRLSNGHNSFRILFSGDFCPIGAVEAACREGKPLNILDQFQDEIEKKELFVANLECPLTSSETKISKVGPNLKADPVAINALLSCKIDIAVLGNNHIMDYGADGLCDTLELLEKHNIIGIGAGENISEAINPFSKIIESIKTSLLVFCETEFNIAEAHKSGCVSISHQSVFDQIGDVSESSDITVVLIHCGSEHFPLPSPRIKQVCHKIVESGASAVICHHTHNFEGYEVYDGVPIFYGLGNFIFDKQYQKTPAHWYEGFMVAIDFNEVSAIGFKIIPYQFDPKEIQVKKLNPIQTTIFEIRLALLCEIISDDEKLSKIWKAYSLRRYKYWYSGILRKNQNQFWKSRKKRALLLWHYMANESHSDIIQTALDAMRKSGDDVDEEIERILCFLIGKVSWLDRVKNVLRYWI